MYQATLRALVKTLGSVADWTANHVIVVLTVLSIAMIFVAVAGLAVAFLNRGSETIGLGFTALIGAMVLFSVQLGFQLRQPPTLEESVVAQILVDHETKRAMSYPPGGEVGRIIVEQDANKLLASRDPFPDDSRIVSDLVVYSFLSYLIVSDPDWRMQRAVVEFPSWPGSSTTFSMSDPQQATIIPVASIPQLLRGANNLFADVPVVTVFEELRLPRGSKLTVEGGKVTITAPALTIVVAASSSILGGIPKKKPNAPLEITETGGRYKLHLVRLSFRSEMNRWLSRDPDMEAYRAWFERMVAGSRAWFKPSGSGLE